MAKNNHTPDRQQNPDDDERFKPCLVCNGTARVLSDSFHEEQGEDPERKPEPEDYEKCTNCKGEGEIEIEKWEEEW